MQNSASDFAQMFLLGARPVKRGIYYAAKINPLCVIGCSRVPVWS